VAKELGPGKNMVVNISGRGDKDVEVAAQALGIGAQEAEVVSDAVSSNPASGTDEAAF
jgi:tryptophan synthase beta chain